MMNQTLAGATAEAVAPAYTRFADVYDQVGQLGVTDRLLNGYLDQLLHAYGWHGASVLDVGCGTGAFVVGLATRGWRVAGIDLAASMIQRAAERARKAGQPVMFAVQDARALGVKDGTFELVTCCNDCLSHLLDVSDLCSAVHAVGRCLRPGGLFLFDIPSLYAVSTLWPGDDVGQDDAMRWHWHSVYDPATHVVSAQLHYWLHSDGSQFTEVHRHRGYSVQAIDEALKAAGLQLRDVFDWGTLTPASDRTGKLQYVASKV